MGNIKSEVAKMAEQDDATRCGICGEPFKDGEVAVQAMRPFFSRERWAEKFWAHAVCVFTVARAEGPSEKPSEKLKSK
jgi:hypothetical protein